MLAACAGAAWLDAAAVSGAQAGAASPRQIGGRKQLFLDESLVASSRGVTLTMNSPYQTGELLFSADSAGERAVNAYLWGYCSVLREPSKTRLWYAMLTIQRPPPPGYQYDYLAENLALAYAESADGLHFTRPNLDLQSYRDPRIRNVVLKDLLGPVWLDARAPADARFRSQAKGRDGKLHFSASPDGLVWRPSHSVPIGDNDTQSIVFWDRGVGRYALYTRRWMRFPDRETNFRTHRRLESDDLVRWDNEVGVLAADDVDLNGRRTDTGQPALDWYGALVFRYPDDDGLYVMLGEAFWHWYTRNPKGRLHEKLGPDAMDVRLFASRDGKDFRRVGGRKPFLRLGPEGSFYSRNVWALPQPVRVGDELWFYYSGSNMDHMGHIDPMPDGKLRSGIGRAVLRLDGFVSADSDYAGGELTTPLLGFEGNALELNVDTSGGGSVAVELLGEDGRPLPGYALPDATPICANSVRAPVSWGGRSRLDGLAGKPVRLRFVMRDAKLYAFQFKTLS
jgi:hypothetical protein